MSEKNNSKMNTEVLDHEYSEEEHAVNEMSEESERIDQAIETLQENKEESRKEPETPETPETPQPAQNDEDTNQLEHDDAAAKAILEGLLFIVGDEGLNREQASMAMGISQERVQELFSILQKEYTDDARGIELADYGGIFRFLSKASVHPYAKKLFQIAQSNSLSQSALETLAIIAYKQPVTRVEIEEIRGVGADMMLRKLLARDLIKESGRSEAPGRPILYEVTPEFMDTFKLLSLEELPDLPEFSQEQGESDDLFRQ